MKEILFRASGISALMTESRGVVITEKQLELIEQYKEKKSSGKSLTEKQSSELQSLIAKRDEPPQLSDTAKRFVEQMWLRNEKGYMDISSNRYTEKGLYNEDDEIELVREVDGLFLIEKNETRITKGNITGECDVITFINGEKVIKDVKGSWDAKTFMGGDLSSAYEWQGITYMYLYDADEFHLHYCLMDCPSHLFENEVWKLKNRFNIIDETAPEVEGLFAQLRRNLIYSDNPAYTKEERVKTYVIKRDKDKEQQLLAKIPLALEYYESIKLNQI